MLIIWLGTSLENLSQSQAANLFAKRCMVRDQDCTSTDVSRVDRYLRLYRRAASQLLGKMADSG
jgi:hypothetical protein